MKGQKFSVIIPVKNGAKTIERLFGSLIIQKEKIYEVLVCNDASIDNTEEIANRYKGFLPITVLNVPKELQNNPGHARQLGLDYATGDWAVFADSDDILTFNAFGYYQSVLQAATNCKMIVGAFDEVNYDPFYILDHLYAPYPWVHGKAYNLDFIREHNIRFHDVLFTHEDKYFNYLILFTMRALGMEEPFVDDVTTYYWCRSQGTIVSQKDGQYPILSLIDSMDATIDSCEKVADRYGLSREQINKLYKSELLESILDSYNKVQCASYVWGYEVLEQYDIMRFVPLRIEKVKDITGWTNEDIISLCLDDAGGFNRSKADSVRTMKEFVPKQTIYEYINQMGGNN